MNQMSDLMTDLALTPKKGQLVILLVIVLLSNPARQTKRLVTTVASVFILLLYVYDRPLLLN